LFCDHLQDAVETGNTLLHNEIISEHDDNFHHLILKVLKHVLTFISYSSSTPTSATIGCSSCGLHTAITSHSTGTCCRIEEKEKEKAPGFINSIRYSVFEPA